MTTQLGYQDAKATPDVSPLTVTDESSFALQVPVWANKLTIKGDVAWKHGEGQLDASAAGNGYCNASAGAWQDLPVVAGGMFRGQTTATTVFEFFFSREE